MLHLWSEQLILSRFPTFATIVQGMLGQAILSSCHQLSFLVLPGMNGRHAAGTVRGLWSKARG